MPPKKKQGKKKEQVFQPQSSSTAIQTLSEELFPDSSESSENERVSENEAFSQNEDTENDRNAENIPENDGTAENTTNRNASKARKRRYKDAGLLIPPGLIRKKLIKGKYAKIIRKDAAVMMAGTLEYLVSELLDMARECALKNKKQRITPRHLMIAIRNDHEYSELLQNVTIPNSGVMPHIHEVLLQKPRKRSLTDEPGTSGSAPKKRLLHPVNESSDSD